MNGIKGVRNGWMGIMILAGLAIAAFFSVAAVADPKGAEFKVELPVTAPAVIAVRFRHDMCPYCKAFDPQVADLHRKTRDEPVLFVTLDLSSEVSQRQAALLIGALGLEAAWPGDFTKIGMYSFVDGKSKKVISELRAEDVASVRKALSKAVASVHSGE